MKKTLSLFLCIISLVLVSGCTQYSLVEEYVKSENITCLEICESQPHESCDGFTWNITGEAPDCNCEYYCNESVSEESEEGMEEEGEVEEEEVCEPEWECTSWSECSVEEVKTRNCTDVNNCGTVEDKPSESESCTYETEEMEAVCGDGICNNTENCSHCPSDCLNQGEVCCEGVVYEGDCCNDSDCPMYECLNHTCTDTDELKSLNITSIHSDADTEFINLTILNTGELELTDTLVFIVVTNASNLDDTGKADWVSKDVSLQPGETLTLNNVKDGWDLVNGATYSLYAQIGMTSNRCNFTVPDASSEELCGGVTCDAGETCNANNICVHDPVRMGFVEFKPPNPAYDELVYCNDSEKGLVLKNRYETNYSCNDVIETYEYLEIINNPEGKLNLEFSENQNDHEIPRSFIWIEDFFEEEAGKYGVNTPINVSIVGPYQLNEYPPDTIESDCSEVISFFDQEADKLSVDLEFYDMIFFTYLNDMTHFGNDKQLNASTRSQFGRCGNGSEVYHDSTSIFSSLQLLEFAGLLQDVGIFLGAESLRKDPCNESVSFPCCKVPEGIPEPNKSPLFPQSKACMMAGLRQLAEYSSTFAALNETVICNYTAGKLGWD